MENTNELKPYRQKVSLNIFTNMKSKNINLILCKAFKVVKKAKNTVLVMQVFFF